MQTPLSCVGSPAPTRIAGPPLQLRSQPPVVASAAGLLSLEQGLILAEILVRLQRSNHFPQHWTHVALVHGTHQASRINILRLLCLASAAARTVVTNRHRALFVALVELEQIVDRLPVWPHPLGHYLLPLSLRARRHHRFRCSGRQRRSTKPLRRPLHLSRRRVVPSSDG